MKKVSDSLPVQIEKEIIFVEKHLEWLKDNVPNTDISDLEKRLASFKDALPLMKSANPQNYQRYGN